MTFLEIFNLGALKIEESKNSNNKFALDSVNMKSEALDVQHSEAQISE